MFTGTVISGHGRGKTLTFPTLNLRVNASERPENGVYAVRVHLSNEEAYGVMHVGPRPTFHEDDVSVEVHLLDRSGEVHEERVTVHVFGKIREVQSFESTDALKKQIEKDIMMARSYFDS